MMACHPRRAARRGVSYLELCLAVSILGVCLVPALRLLPGLVAGQRHLETQAWLAAIAQEKVETALLELEAGFAARDDSGDLADSGHPGWRYHLVVEIPAAGGGRYATVRSEAWADEDGDLALGPDEPQVRFDTLQANCEWSP